MEEESRLESYEDYTSKEIEEALESEGIILDENEREQIVKALTLLLKKIKGEAYAYPYYPYPEPKGEGVVYESKELREKNEKIAEMLRSGFKIKEQWVTPIVKGTHEIVGHVREFLPVSQVLLNKPGDTVHAAVVRDFDFGDFGTYGSPTLSDETGTDVISFASATVEEAGVKFYMKDHLREKADANIVELVNEVCRKAALRAEDKKVLNAIASTTGVLEIDHSTDSSNFDGDWVFELIDKYTAAGKAVDPGDIVLFISPAMHEALLKDIAGSLALSYVKPTVVQKGLLTQFAGVTIRVVDPTLLPDDGGSPAKKYAVSVLKNKAHIFAPKREVKIEADPDPANRRTLIVATTALAYALVDPNSGCIIKTPATS